MSTFDLFMFLIYLIVGACLLTADKIRRMVVLQILLILVLFATPCLAQDKKLSEVDKAKAAIQAEQQARMKKCSETLKKALEDNKCSLEVGMLVTTKGNIPQVQIVPQD